MCIVFSMMSSSLHRRWAQVAVRGLHSRRKTKGSAAIPQQLIDNLPVQKVEVAEAAPEDPDYYHRNPVTSAHAIDVSKGEVSTLDSVALSPSGSVVHGRYGELGPAAEGIPLEYMALLKPAAEGAAAFRSLLPTRKLMALGLSWCMAQLRRTDSLLCSLLRQLVMRLLASSVQSTHARRI